MEDMEDKNQPQCKTCGCYLFSQKSIKAGHCGTCASANDTARQAWIDNGLATFCGCGLKLSCKESIELGKCYPCREKEAAK